MLERFSQILFKGTNRYEATEYLRQEGVNCNCIHKTVVQTIIEQILHFFFNSDQNFLTNSSWELLTLLSRFLPTDQSPD